MPRSSSHYLRHYRAHVPTPVPILPLFDLYTIGKPKHAVDTAPTHSYSENMQDVNARSVRWCSILGIIAALFSACGVSETLDIFKWGTLDLGDQHCDGYSGAAIDR